MNLINSRRWRQSLQPEKYDSGLVNKSPRVKKKKQQKKPHWEESAVVIVAAARKIQPLFAVTLPPCLHRGERLRRAKSPTTEMYCRVSDMLKRCQRLSRKNVEHIYHSCCSDPFAGFCLNKVPCPVCLSLHCHCPPLTPPPPPPPSPPIIIPKAPPIHTLWLSPRGLMLIFVGHTHVLVYPGPAKTICAAKKGSNVSIILLL